MGPILESPLPSRPKVNDEVFTPLQPVIATHYIVTYQLWDYDMPDAASPRATRGWHTSHSSPASGYEKGQIQDAIS